MNYSTFNQTPNNQLLEPLFLGQSVNVSRFDQDRHPALTRLLDKQISFFWTPEEVDISKDRADWQKLSDTERHIFISNLKYQTLLDSMTARSVSVLLLPLVSDPIMEVFVETHSFFESIHSRSYTHILRNLFTDPSAVFDDIVVNPAILARASSISIYFDDLLLYSQVFNLHGEGTHIVRGESIKVSARVVKEKLYLAICALNSLESIRFYVSFACSFSFSERALLEGNSKLLKLIARDENCHMSATQFILNTWASGKDDPEMVEVCRDMESQGRQLFLDVVEQEKEWANYLFKDGSMIGLNATILNQYLEYVATQRMAAIGLVSPFDVTSNPLPWINTYLSSDNVQESPQESEISSYLVGAVDSSLSNDDLSGFDL